MTIKDELNWEQFYSNSSLKINYLPEKVDKFNRMVFHTKNFFAIVGYGAFSKGYLLLVSKNIISAFALIDKNLVQEYQWLVNLSINLLKDIYKDHSVAVFEHGMCACVGGLDRAHLHLIPYKISNNENIETAINKSLKRRRIGIEYVVFENEKYSNAEDIDNLIENFQNREGFKIKGEYLTLNNIKGNLNIKDYPLNLRHHALNGKTYIYFNSSHEKSSFITNYNADTQLGREIIFNYLCIQDKNFLNEIRSNFNVGRPFFWRWQDYMFEENILDTIKDISLSNYFKKEVEHKYNLVFYT